MFFHIINTKFGWTYFWRKMKYLTNSLIILGVGLLSCSTSFKQKAFILENTEIASQISTETRIKHIPDGFPDFENFKFPQFCVEGDNTSFLMKNGEYKDEEELFRLAGVKYADVTGDNKEEAIVVVDVNYFGGNAMPRCVYIFQSIEPKEKKVKLIWKFFAGDRAYGGLRNIYGENGQLVVETYFAQKLAAACCPRYYIVEKYKWQSEKFKRTSRKKLENISKQVEPQIFK